MKTCSACKKPKPIDQFSKNRARRDGLQNRCKPCSKKGHKAYYQANRNRMRQQIYTHNRTRIAENQERVFQYLLDHPCVDCGHFEPCVAEFDHRDPSTKFREVSKLITEGYSWQAIQTEIEKCDVRCANCHRRKTAKDQKWFTWRLAQHLGPVA